MGLLLCPKDNSDVDYQDGVGQGNGFQHHDQVGNMGTTELWLVGQILDRKSNVCPIPVQSPSKDCPKTGRLEGLSSHRPSTVQALSNLCQVLKHLDKDWTGKSRDCREFVH